jgi:hypothetical protein
LFLNGPKAFQRQETSQGANNSQEAIWHVCRGQNFTPWIAGRFGIGVLFLFGGTSLYLDCRQRWLNRLGVVLFVLGFLIGLAPVPWDLGPCSVDKPSNETQYRKTFPHDEPQRITNDSVFRSYIGI